MSVAVNRAKEIFLAALDKSGPERAAFLDAECDADNELRRRVEAMLRTHADSGELLPRSPAEMLDSVDVTGADATSAFDSQAQAPSTEPDAATADDLSFLAPALQAGARGRLGHYEIREVIGKGGFGIVLKAFDERLHRVVAIKVLAPAFANNGTAVNRFIREAKTAAAVKNEHVVAIYDVEKDARPPYLAMEMIDGISVQEKIDKHGPLGVKEILRIGMQMAEGLAAAHKQGLVHRDIKPANILLENGVERVKITDFGLARAVDDASVTQSGTVAGTPMYMSPEQAEGVQIDHRSDLFSLGTVLYAMCTGHPPFRASGTHAVLKRVIDASPRPIQEINNEIPEWLCDIIAKLHAKKPEERFQTAKEVAELLGQHLAHLQQPSTAPRPAAVQLTPPRDPTLAPLSPAKPRHWITFAALVVFGGPILAGFTLMAVFSGGHGTFPLVMLIGATLLGLAAIPVGMYLPLTRLVLFRSRLSFPLIGALYVSAVVLGFAAVLFYALDWPKFGTARALLYVHWFEDKDGPPVQVLLETDDPKNPGGVKSEVLIAETGRKDVTRIVRTRDQGDVSVWASWAGYATVVQVPPDKNFVLRALVDGKEFHRQAMSMERGKTQKIDLPDPPRLLAREGAAKDGWLELLNGSDLTGWKKHPTLPSEWKVENGLLCGHGGFLFSDRGDYQDFHLRLEAKVSPTEFHWSSQRPTLKAIAMWHAEFGANWQIGNFGKVPLGYSQTLAGGGLEYSDGKGSRIVASNASGHVVNEQWFTQEIIVRGNHVVTRINDREIVNHVDKSHSFKKGHLVLAGREAKFFRIAIKELPPEDPGWVQLFNGKDLKAWKLSPATDWTVQQDTLVGAPSPSTGAGSCILSTERADFQDYHLRFTAKTLLELGIACRIGDKGGYSFDYLRSQNGCTFTRYGKDDPMPQDTRWALPAIAADAWFDGEMIVQGSRMTFLLNGVKVGELTGMAIRKGRINLIAPPVQGNVVQFKKIEIKELPPEEPGWVQLFNNKDLDGWTTLNKGVWAVEGDELVGDGRKQGGYLRTQRGDFVDFHLRGRARISDFPGPAKANVWVRFNSNFAGYKAHLSTTAGETGALLVRDQAGDPATTLLEGNESIPPKTWFDFEVIAKGPKITVKINGKTSAEAIHDRYRKGRIALEVWHRSVVHFKNIEIKELPPEESKLPESADQVLPALAGAWKGEYTQKIYGGKPDVKKISAVAVNDWIVGQKWLRQRVQMENEGFLSVTTFESSAKVFRDYFFHARGLIFGPSTGRWDPATRTMTWTNLPEAGVILLMTLRFVDADSFAGEILVRDKEGKTVFEMASLMKRTTENFAIDETTSAGPLPLEMAVLDRLVGDWQVAGVIKDAENPTGFKATWNEAARRILGGRVIVAQQTGPGRDKDAFSLSTFDTFSKAYGRWLFKADGSVLEYGGGWDEKSQTMKWHWAGKDGSQSSNTWHWPSADRRDWQVVTKDALDKTTFEVQATSVRQSPAPAVAPFDAKKAKEHQDAWAKHLGVEPEISNSVGMKLRLIPPGEFTMGSRRADPDHRPEEAPPHWVTISKPYYLASTHVTVAQFKTFGKEKNYKTQAETNGGAPPPGEVEYDPRTNWLNPGFKQTDECPVVCMSWNDAKAFCEWLSQKEGKTYVLPSEAQWEYACRAGSNVRFYFGDDDEELTQHAWYIGNAELKTHPVRQKKQNPWGLFDMHGNAWQWIADWYSADYYEGQVRENPPGPATGATRVLRGGAWNCGFSDSRAARRAGDRGPNYRDTMLGFRVALIGELKAKSPPATASD